MKAAPVISLGLSVILGVAALIIGRGWLFPGSEVADATQLPPEQPVAQQPVMTRPVLLAREGIEPGTLVTPELVEAGDWPVSLELPAALRRTDELAARDGVAPVARGFIAAGEPLLEAKLAYEPPRRYLAQNIPKGKRAASITVTLETGVAGFVLPGNRVDINAFKPNPGATGPQAYKGETLLKGVLVLAVDQNFDTYGEGAMPSRVVTLALSEAEVLKISSAARDSQLGLALIGDEETDILEAREKGEQETARQPAPAAIAQPTSKRAPAAHRAVPRAPAPTPKPRPAMRTEVDVVHGTDRQTVETPVASEGAAS
jgi:pilus assembly protein CpaB